jgi:CxxC motif-containing protein
MEKKLICISCPVGCRLTVRVDDQGTVTVTGNTCVRGEEYGREEALAPRRVVTATAAIRSAIQQRIPVRTSHPLPKELIPGLLREIYRLDLSPPVAVGEVLIPDYGSTGVDVVATRSIGE